MARLALAGAGEGWCPAFSRAVFRAQFAEGRDISDRGVLEAILDGLGVPAADAFQAALSDTNKAALRNQTEAAMSLGVFGAPSFVAEGELFWGDDRLEDAVDWLARTR